ncbi:MAG: hypothetical protein ACJA02_000352, partial [Myxococcota bacterium]
GSYFDSSLLKNVRKKVVTSEKKADGIVIISDFLFHCGYGYRVVGMGFRCCVL